MSESDTNNTNVFYMSFLFIIFILNLVVITNTSRPNFKSLGHELYYDFELFNLVSIGVLVVCHIVYTVGITFTVTHFNKKLINRLTIDFILLYLCLIVTNLYYMGSIWHDDPNHSIFVYEEYWKESVMDFSCLNSTHVNINLTQSLRNVNICRVYDKKWVYVMSDVIVRIYSFGLILIFSILLPIIVCCICCFKIMEIGDQTIYDDPTIYDEQTIHKDQTIYDDRF